MQDNRGSKKDKVADIHMSLMKYSDSKDVLRQPITTTNTQKYFFSERRATSPHHALSPVSNTTLNINNLNLQVLYDEKTP
jgi:hypothetical protein